MEYRTAERMARVFAQIPPKQKLCPHCYHVLALTKEGEWYCPNEMCLNDERGEIE